VAVTRPRLAKLQRVAKDVADAARRLRRSSDPKRADADTADELARRLDATRERLQREIPPSEPD
jgi:hypothetical protein